MIGMERVRQQCAHCQATGLRLLAVIDQRGVPPGQDGHTFWYSHVVVMACGSCGRGQIESLDHDCFDMDDVWDQYEWYVLEAADTLQLAQHLSTCPAPMLPTCDCAVHLALRTAVAQLPRTGWRHVLDAERHVRPVRVDDLRLPPC
ncbi:MAG: hypothetical protein AB1791_00450 [Chloroflexota bacterium]